MRHWTALLLCAVVGTAVAAEIKVLSAGAVEPGLRAAAAAFRKQSGHEVNIAFNTTPEIRKRIGGGDAFDVVIAPPVANVHNALSTLSSKPVAIFIFRPPRIAANYHKLTRRAHPSL